jgi:hypothetical protein
MYQQQLQTPVVFIVFNRPAQTRISFARIAEAAPSRLLVIADGPRPEKVGEAVLCDEVRAIATAVDWPCRLEINFSPGNMGCRERIISGLNWVFERAEDAIIVEDDVVPDPSFFPFCEQLLNYYRGDDRISMVAGFNPVEYRGNSNQSYFFSQLTHVWGWATWRNSWARYDQHLKNWPEIKQADLLNEIFDRPGTAAYWTNIFDAMHDGTGPNTWDYQWTYTNLIHNALSIAPKVNLVKNIGFDRDATHTVAAADIYKINSQAIAFPLIHPPAFVPLRSVDRRDLELTGCRVPSLLERIRTKLTKLLSRPHQE